MALDTTSWFPFWRPRNRFSLEELRYLTEELQKVEIVNDINEDLVIEMLRSIAELMTYGDQHDPSYFEFFMEKQIISEFVRILSISKPTNVSLQLLQTMSIMIQNLTDKNSIYYLFSNGHINYLIEYSFDFQNEEILPYYISFLRVISRKLNKNTISLLVKTKKEEVVSFPLYFQAIQFAFHEDNMIRVAVRALTLSVYNVGDEQVNKYVKCTLQSDYFSNIIRDFYKRCIYLDELIAQSARKLDASDSGSSIRGAINEIEDILYYLSDILSAGVPDLGRLLTDYILEFLVFVLLLPSLTKQSCGTQVGITTSLHLLCSVLNIYNSKDLANIIAAALLCSSEFFSPRSKATAYDYVNVAQETQDFSLSAFSTQENIEDKKSPTSYSNPVFLQNENCGLHITLRELLLAYIVGGDELQVLGSLSLLATLLQTNDLDESVLDGLGILSQRKQHKDLLLQALVGEETREEKIISNVSMSKDNISTELSGYLQKLKVFNALLRLLCRTNISADILWLGGWIMKQLLPYREEDCSPLDLQQLEDSHELSAGNLLEEINGPWCDVLIPLLKDKWNICKKVIEASSPAKDSTSILFPSPAFSSGGESSFAAAGKMCETIKVFVLQRQLLLALGVNLPDLLYTPVNSPVVSRTKTCVLDVTMPKPGSKISLVNAIPCRISFEVGMENNYSFLALSRGTSGWVILAEELPQERQHGVVQVIAPLAASNPLIDEKHPMWLHLCIRPPTLPFIDPSKFDISNEAKDFSDGQWTLAFQDEQACKAAECVLIEELNMQRNEVEHSLKPLLRLDGPGASATPELCTLHKTND